MTIKKSDYTKPMGAKITCSPARKGETITVMVEHTFTEALDTTDILDLFPVVPNGRIVGFEWATANVGAVNLTIGLMSGTPGANDVTRTSGAELASAVSAATGGNVGVAALSAIPEIGGTPVSIGVKTATLIAAGATKKLYAKITILS